MGVFHTSSSPPHVWFTQQTPQDISTAEYSLFKDAISDHDTSLSDYDLIQASLLERSPPLSFDSNGLSSPEFPETTVKDEDFNDKYLPAMALDSDCFSDTLLPLLPDIPIPPRPQAANVNLMYPMTPMEDSAGEWEFSNPSCSKSRSQNSKSKPMESGNESFCLKLACDEFILSSQWEDCQDLAPSKTPVTYPFFEPVPITCESNPESSPPTSVDATSVKTFIFVQKPVFKKKKKVVPKSIPKAQPKSIPKAPPTSIPKAPPTSIPDEKPEIPPPQKPEETLIVPKPQSRNTNKRNSKAPKLRERKPKPKKVGSRKFQNAGKKDVNGKISKINVTPMPPPLVVYPHGTKERGHKCRVCGSIFKRPSSYRIHYSIHSGVKNYKCETCDKPFNVKSNLTRHMRTHREPMIRLIGDSERE